MTDFILLNKNLSVIFPGQGSQSIGMGTPWKNTKSWEITKLAQEITSLDFNHLLLEENDLLNKTEYAQLAILVTSLMAWEENKQYIKNIKYFAGHSLGQITALIATGVFSLEDGLLFAKKRAEVTQSCAKENDGLMAAFIGGSIEDASNLCTKLSNLYIANDNCLGQIVLGGNSNDVKEAINLSKEYNFKLAKIIPVDGAFHTPHMQNASTELEKFLNDTKLNNSTTPVISNDDALPYSDATVWKQKLPLHVTSTVRWSETMDFLSSKTDISLEIGCGSILTGLAKRHKPQISVLNISSPEDITKIKENL